MLIVIDKEWSIKIDKNGSYLLTRWEGKSTVIKSSGASVKNYSHKSHHGSLASCLETYARLTVLSSAEEMTLEQYVKALESAYNKIMDRLDLTKR